MSYIHKPLENDYCGKCVYCKKDGDFGSWYCSRIHYLNCGQIIECSHFIQKNKQTNDGVVKK